MFSRVVVSILIVLFIVIYCAGAVGTQNVKISVPLGKDVTYMNKEMYNDLLHINSSSTIEIDIINNNKNISFVIFQVHSHLYNITLYNNSNIEGSTVSGTNVGLYSSVTPKIDTFFIKNLNLFDLEIFVTVHGYKEKDPIPGGCNMEFPIPISPFMQVSNHKDYIFVDAAPPKYNSQLQCMEVNKVSVEFYMMYLPERDFDADTYFNGIKKMSTLENIRANGEKIPKVRGLLWPIRRMLSAYPGTGTIYVAVATVIDNKEYYSVYVPTHTYACSPEDDDCDLLEDFLPRFLCAGLLFAGIFICFFGHRFFKTEMFAFGMLSGVIITYILISTMTELSQSALLSASIISGMCFGAIWLSFWWFYGIPVIAVTVPALNLGFFLAAIAYNKYPAEIKLLENEKNFWVIFIIVMLLTALILSSVAFVCNIICCTVLGAYAAVYPIDFYLGSNLKYLLINVVRRATVDNFNRAVLTAPLEWRDGLLIALWVALATSGFIFQQYHNRNRPPFPPHPRSTRPAIPTESYSQYGAIEGITRNNASQVAPIPAAKKFDERGPLLA